MVLMKAEARQLGSRKMWVGDLRKHNDMYVCMYVYIKKSL